MGSDFHLGPNFLLKHLFRKASGQGYFRTAGVYTRLRALKVLPLVFSSSLTLEVDAYG